MSLLKKIIKEILNVLKIIYEVLYIYPKFRYEELYEIYEIDYQLNLKKQTERRKITAMEKQINGK